LISVARDWGQLKKVTDNNNLLSAPRLVVAEAFSSAGLECGKQPPVHHRDLIDHDDVDFLKVLSNCGPSAQEIPERLVSVDGSPDTEEAMEGFTANVDGGEASGSQASNPLPALPRRFDESAKNKALPRSCFAREKDVFPGE
jgi:hypothetical protein